ncbi:hypothetical protein ACIHCQ_20940 [Streptomyces sp. NPDC052236]|uniref:hypothetical protein n=1 Tax=Streptomyces sp. NPDC052236 TaxID=3365686 RepID=UPI0037D3D0B3
MREAPKRLQWTFKSTKTWLIAPTRLIEESGPDGREFDEAMLSITEGDQEFCAAAAEDLERILHALESVTERGESGGTR